MFMAVKDFIIFHKRQIIVALFCIAATVVAIFATDLLVKYWHNRLQPPYEKPDPKSIELTVPYNYSGVSMTLPEGFYVNGDSYGHYALNKSTRDYLSFDSISAKDPDAFTEDSLETSLSLTYGEKVGNFRDYTRFEVNGLPAVLLRFDFTGEELLDYCTCVYVFFPEKTVAVYFHELSDVYSDAFVRCIDTFRLEK